MTGREPTSAWSRQIPPACAELLRGAASVAVLTGAGVSKESGISTFREDGGLWSQFDPNEVATVEAFRRDPVHVWNWYAERRRNMAEGEPNPGHVALAQMQQRVSQFTLITQNIDGMHARAGSQDVVELHGNIARVKCLDEGTVVTGVPEDGSVVPPRCPRCGGMLRPDVVWFGEMLPIEPMTRAIRAAQSCDVFLSVGTSGTVEPAASLPLEARRSGAAVVEVNPERTAITPYAAFHLAGPSGEVLPSLLRAAWPE